MRLYTPLVQRWCRGLGLQEADAADVTQDVFREVVGRIGGLRHGPTDSLRAWLRAVTRSKAADRGRDKVPGGNGVGGDPPEWAALPAPAEPTEATGPDEPTDPDEGLVLLRQAVELVLDEFAPATREAYLRVVLHRQPPARVAADLGLSVNAVYLARSRVKKRLRDEFEGLIDL